MHNQFEQYQEHYGSPAYARAYSEELELTIKEAENDGNGDHEAVKTLRQMVREIKEYLALDDEARERRNACLEQP